MFTPPPKHLTITPQIQIPRNNPADPLPESNVGVPPENLKIWCLSTPFCFVRPYRYPVQSFPSTSQKIQDVKKITEYRDLQYNPISVDR